MALRPDDRIAVRATATAFLGDRGFREPPFPVQQALQGEQLRLADVSLEDAMRAAGMSPAEMESVNAMLRVEDRLVVLRGDLHRQGRKWGAVHELAHYVMPAHRELLYFCSILELPARVQKQMELEADAFASDLIFLGPRFSAEAHSSGIGLHKPVSLAESYGASLHSALRRYVEESPAPCCLLVWKILPPGQSKVLKLRYWVRSTTWRGGAGIGQELGEDHVVVRAFRHLDRNPLVAIVEHDARVGDKAFRAESFSNSYEVFTLLF